MSVEKLGNLGQTNLVQLLVAMAVGVIVVTSAAGIHTYMNRIYQQTSQRKESGTYAYLLQKRMTSKETCEDIFSGISGFDPLSINPDDPDTHFEIPELVAGGDVLARQREFISGTSLRVDRIAISEVVRTRTENSTRISAVKMVTETSIVVGGQVIGEPIAESTFDLETTVVGGNFVSCHSDFSDSLGITANCPFENSLYFEPTDSSPAHEVNCLELALAVAESHEVRDELLTHLSAPGGFATQGGMTVKGTLSIDGPGATAAVRLDDGEVRACLDDGETDCPPAPDPDAALQMFKPPCDQVEASMDYVATDPVPPANQCVSVACPQEKPFMAGYGFKNIFLEDPGNPPPGANPNFDFRGKKKELRFNQRDGTVSFCYKTKDGVTYSFGTVTPDLGNNVPDSTYYRPGAPQGWKLSLWGYCCEKNN